MKQLILFVSLSCVLGSNMVWAQLTLDLHVANPMPSELSAWENDPTLLQAIITNTDPNAYTNLRLSFVIRDEQTQAVVVRSQDAELPRFDVQALSALTRSGPAIYQGGAVEIDERIRNIAITTNRLPEGDFTLCMRLIDEFGNNIATNGEVCIGFTVIIPDPPELLLPDDAAVVRDPYPTFRWTPVYIRPGIEEARYRLVIAQVEQGQTPRDAIDRNTPHFDAIINTNSYTYSIADPPFAFGAAGLPYAWQVQAINRDNLPAARNDGKSGIRTFCYHPAGSGSFSYAVTSTSPMPLQFNQATVSHPLNFRLYAGGCSRITVTRAVGRWTTPDDSTMESAEDLRGENIIIQPGDVHVWAKTLTFDLAMQQALLRRFGGDEVRIVISYEFEGVDDLGETYYTMISTDIEAVIRSSCSNVLSCTVTSPSPMPLQFNPVTVSHPVNFRLFAAPEGCRSITVTRAIGTWTTPDDSAMESEEDLRGENIVLQPGELRVWAKTLSFDLAMQQALLRRFGGDEVRVVISYEFEGVDNAGELYHTMILTEIEARIRSSCSGALSYSVTSTSPMPLQFNPSTFSHPVNFRLFAAPEGCRSITVTRAVGTWTLPGGSADTSSEDLSGQNIVIPLGEVRVWAKTLSLDLAMQQALLRRFGGNEVQVLISYEFEGVDDLGGTYHTMIATDIVAIIRVSTFSVTTSSLSGFPLNFSPGVRSHPVSFSFNNTSSQSLHVTGYVATWYKPDGTFDIVPDNLPMAIDVPAGETRVWDTNLPLDSTRQAFLLNNFAGGGNEVSARINYSFVGTDQDGITREAIAVPDINYNVRRTTPEQLVVWAMPGAVSFFPGKTTNRITYNLDLYPQATAPVTLASTRVTFRTPEGLVYGTPDSSALPAVINLAVGGTTTTQANLTVTDLDRDAILAGGLDRRTMTTTVEFIGANTLGQAISAQSSTIEMTILRLAPEASTDSFTLIPGVALIRPTERTIITPSGNRRTLNGSATLVIFPDPFDTAEVTVDLTNLVFEGDPLWHVTSGQFMAESAPNAMLFSLYGGILKLTRLRYDHSLSDSLRFLADGNVSIFRSRIDLTDIIINRDGISLRNASVEFSMFGLTFRVNEMRSGKEGDRRMMAFTTHVRMKGKPRQDEFVTSPLKIFDNHDIAGHFTPTPSLQIIPSTHYLDFRDFEFKKEAEQWFMKVTVTTAYPGPLRSLSPIETSFKIDQDNNITGEVAPIREMTPGIGDGDRTWVQVGEFANIDLTYLGIQLALMDGEIDEEHSRVGLAADFYFNDGTRDWHRVGVGSVDNPGITIDFTGNVNWQAISIANDKKIKLGPVYVRILSFIVNPEPDSVRPYFFSLSGGLGIDLPKVDGEVDFQTIRIKENGKLDMSEAIIRGGQFSVVNVVGLRLDSLAYKDEPSDLTFKRKVGGRSEEQTLRVDSYFMLAGAALNIGPSGDGGSGSFKELLVYRRLGETNFVLKEAQVTIASCVIKLDCQYISNDSLLGTSLTAAGSVRTPKFEGTVVGKLGETAAHEPSYGLFIAVSGLNIQIGPVTLDQLGGGFFYNPLESDIAMVRNACGINRPEIRDSIRVRRPPGAGDPGSFAAMVFAGVFIGSRDVANGRGLITLTENSLSLDMEVRVLKGAGEGAAYTVLSWDPSYLEGVIKFELDYQSVVTADAEVNFYSYSSDVWGFSGDTDVKILCLIEANSDFFVGPPGFMVSTELEMGFDIGVLSASAGFETMVWWQKDVSWGAYAKVHAEGEILWGLAGVSGSLEGALIGDRSPLLYTVGSFRAEVAYVEVFDGSIWMTVGADGFDGGTGRNARYDQLIDDARHMANQMEEEMDELDAAISAAQDALLSMSNEQVAHAGEALMTSLTQNALATALYYVSYSIDHDDYEGTATTQNALRQILFGSTPRNNRWWLDTLITGKQELEEKEQAIREAIDALNAKRQRMQRRLGAYTNLLTGQLPTIRDLEYMSPGGAARETTIVINGVGRRVQYSFEFDSLRANQNRDNAEASRDSNEAYESRLFELTNTFKRNLDTIDNLLYGGTEPIRNISKDYTDAFEDINDLYTDTFDYLFDVQQIAARRRQDLRGREGAIRTAIHTQTEAVAPNENALWRLRNLNTLRQGVIASLDDSYNPQLRNNTLAAYKQLCDTLGVLMWYRIPEAGFVFLINSCSSSRDTARGVFTRTRSAFLTSWYDYTRTLDGIYSTTSRLYELLYDLYDQLSLTATRVPLSPAKRRQLGNPTARQYFNGERNKIGTMLEMPSITSYTGSARSSTDHSSKVSLSFAGTHTNGIAEYAYKVKYPPAPPPGPGIIIISTPAQYRSVGTDTRTSFLLVQDYGTNRPDRPGDYDITVRARTRSGYAIHRMGTVDVEYSTGSTVSHTLSTTDNSAPTTPVVNDSAQYTSARSVISASWSASDPQSGIQEYQYSVETERAILVGGRWVTMPWRIREWTSVGGMTAFNIRDLSLEHAKTYWVKVRAGNGVGLWSDEGRTDGVTVDTSKPSMPTIVAFRRSPGAGDPSRLYLDWDASSDAESGISSYQFCIGTTPHGTDLLDWTGRAANASVAFASNLPLRHQQTVYATVRAVNGASLATTDTAVTTIAFTDTTAPDRPDISQSYYRMADSILIAHWTCNDAQSGVVQYLYQHSKGQVVGGQMQYTPWRSAGLETTIALKTPPRPVFFRVKAINGVGLSSFNTSSVDRR